MKPAGLDYAEGVVSVAFAKEYSDPQWANDPARQAYGAFMDKYLPGVPVGNLIRLASEAESRNVSIL